MLSLPIPVTTKRLHSLTCPNFPVTCQVSHGLCRKVCRLYLMHSDKTGRQIINYHKEHFFKRPVRATHALRRISFHRRNHSQRISEYSQARRTIDSQCMDMKIIEHRPNLSFKQRQIDNRHRTIISRFTEHANIFLIPLILLLFCLHRRFIFDNRLTGEA